MLKRKYSPAEIRVLARGLSVLPARRERRAVVLIYLFSALLCAGFLAGLPLER